MGLQLHFGRSETFARGQIVAETMMRAGDDAVLDLAVMDRKTQMRAGILETGNDGTAPE
jgi:hypothetical protein